MRNADVRLLPRTIKQREHAMIEDPEKLLERVISRAFPLRDVQAVRERERTLRAGESQEVHRHLRLSVALLETLNLARRKGNTRCAR